MISNKINILLSAISGLLLTGAFPKIGLDWLVWFALAPMLYAIKDLSPRTAFRMGFFTGLIHFLSLLYWLVPVMRTYGYLPAYLSVAILFLFASVLAVFIALFATGFTAIAKKPLWIPPVITVLWVALEYVRSFIFSGFPWGYLGHSQFNNLHLIQISDIFGVYGLSALIAIANAGIFLSLLYFSKKRWQEREITKRLMVVSLIAFSVGITLTLAYGYQRLKTIDNLIATSPKARIAVVQGNIDQAIKWDPAFQIETIKKYNRLSSKINIQRPDLIIWPESATPFYFLFDVKPSEMVFEGIRQTATDYLIGSPSFKRTKDAIQYYNSAYLIRPDKKHMSRYDKTHLVPFGEYVPFKKWLPFLGKIVAQVGDFKTGEEGKTLRWEKELLGVQICYEIIFPNLSRALVKNDASLLINITNDAWFGKTSGPYQHFSMAVFRAVENRRALARSANTGISGFIDPAGRVVESTALLEEAAIIGSLPMLKAKTIYTNSGDLFAQLCLVIVLLVILVEIVKFVLKFRG